MKNTLISVVMPIYNKSRYLGKSVESVLNQTYKNIELIMVDDASTDNSLEIARSYEKRDSRVSVIACEANQGVAKARNLGIAASKGEYIALLDSDDEWLEEKLEKQLSLIESRQAQIAYCSYDFIDENSSMIRKPFVVPVETNYKEMLVSSVISCSTALVDASLLKAHPFRSDFYHEDFALWMELLALPVKTAGDPQVLAHYRQLPDSRSGNKLKSAFEKWKVYRKCLGMSFVESSVVFLKYSMRGFMKYYK